MLRTMSAGICCPLSLPQPYLATFEFPPMSVPLAALSALPVFTLPLGLDEISLPI